MVSLIKQEFFEYIEIKNTSWDELENTLDFTKHIDIDNYNIDVIHKQGDILSEVQAWSKFIKNNYQKQSIRDFQPFLTRGEISEFILNRLNLFDKDGNLIGFDKFLDDSAKKLLEHQLKTSIGKLKILKRKSELLKETINLYSDIMDKIERYPNQGVVQTIKDDFRRFLLDSKNKLTAEELFKHIENSLPNSLLKLFNKDGRSQIADELFDFLTDYSLRDMGAYSRIMGKLKSKWSLKLRRFFTGKEDAITIQTVFDTVQEVFRDLQKEFFMTSNLFKLDFNSALSKVLSKRLSMFDFNSEIRRIIRTYGKNAFRNGIEYLGLDPDDFKAVEKLVLNNVMKISNNFIVGLSNRVFNGVISTAQALITSDMWSNKIIKKIFQFGNLVADRDGLYEWVFGDTKHCPSCLYANGQRHRLKHWWKAGIIPQNNGSKNLICGGYHCKCRLVRVTGKAIGRLDRIPVA